MTAEYRASLGVVGLRNQHCLFLVKCVRVNAAAATREGHAAVINVHPDNEKFDEKALVPRVVVWQRYPSFFQSLTDITAQFYEIFRGIFP